MMDWRDYYLREVYPRLHILLRERYPLVSLDERSDMSSLADRQVFMLVALTGTGKSTTLKLLRARPCQADIIPTRRELADWVAIPMAQALAGEPIEPIRDRARRFAYTRRFAKQAPGGMAAVFASLHIADEHGSCLLSEGIRGQQEIAYALEHCARWQVIELTLNPLTRLRRLSGRHDAFDLADGTADLSFLPRGSQAEARALLQTGEISKRTLGIVKAEAANYGFEPFAGGDCHANYHRVAVDGLSPGAVADAVTGIIQRETGARGTHASNSSH